MATHGRRPDSPLSEQLYADSFRFDFFQAVKLLEQISSKKNQVGSGSEPDKEPVRFKPRVAHDFPASQIDTLFPAEQKKPPVMVTNFMGLAGCHGPLPIAYTELILERVSNKDSSLKDFLDIFNHRLISIFYRIRKTCRIAFEQSDPAGSNFSRYLLALLGIGTKGLQNRMQVKDRAFLYYTGLCSQKPFSMSSLEAVLSHYFQIKVKGRQVVGRWLELEPDQHTKIGLWQGANQTLGGEAVLGTRFWDPQASFILGLTSLTFKEFSSFLPLGEAYAPICQLTRLACGDEFDYDLKLLLQAEEVPQTRLGKKHGARLGWSTWLKAEEKQTEEGEVRITPRLITTLRQNFRIS